MRKTLPVAENTLEIHWHEMPLVRITLALCAGIFLARFSVALPIWTIVLAAIVLLAAISFLHMRWQYQLRLLPTVLIHCLFVGLGFQMHQIHDETLMLAHIGDSKGQNTYELELLQAPIATQKGLKAMAKVLTVQGENMEGGVLLHLNAKNTGLVCGDKLRFDGALKPITNHKNSSFDFAQYCRNKHITHVAYSQNILVPYGRTRFSFRRTAEGVRDHCLKALERHLPEGNELAVGKALLLGYNGDLDETLSAAYRETGATHILAVSGMHIGLIYMALAFLLGFVRSKKAIWKWTEWLLLLFAIWTFAMVAGASGSVLRAAMMFTFISLGRVAHRQTNMYNLMAASGLALLLSDAYLLFDIGFQLSYLAVVGIVYFYPIFYKLFFVKSWLLDRVWQMTALGCAAQLATLPLILFYFGQFPVYFWLSGLLAVPSSTLALFAGIAVLFTDLIGFGAEIAAYLFYSTLWLMNQSIYLTHALPFHLIEGIKLHIVEFIALFLVVILVGIAARTAQLKHWNIALGLLCLLLVGHQALRFL